jgi:hypothetical protein
MCIGLRVTRHESKLFTERRFGFDDRGHSAGVRRSHDCFESIHRLVGKFDPPSVPLKTEDVNSTCNDRARNVNRERLQLGTMMRPAGPRWALPVAGGRSRGG